VSVEASDDLSPGARRGPGTAAVVASTEAQSWNKAASSLRAQAEIPPDLLDGMPSGAHSALAPNRRRAHRRGAAMGNGGGLQSPTRRANTHSTRREYSGGSRAFRASPSHTVAEVQLFRGKQRRAVAAGERATAYRLRRDGAEVSNPDIAIGANTDRYWLLRVDRRRRARCGGPKLLLGWVREIVWLARGDPPFTLAYGSVMRNHGVCHRIARSRIPPRTPISTQRWRDRASGAVKSVEGDRPPCLATTRAGRTNRRQAVVALGSARDRRGVLGWMAWRLLKQMDRRSRGPADAPVILEATILSFCGHHRSETMPTTPAALLRVHRMPPRSQAPAGDCCVFCSYASAKCPPRQQSDE